MTTQPSPPAPISRSAREGETWQRRRRRGVEAAQDLRAQTTPAEALLWKYLRRDQLNGLRFRRQHPIGGYIADFACPLHKLVIEVDGSIHEFQKEDDERRTACLCDRGYRVVRFSNEEVLNNIESVLNQIISATQLPLSCEAGEGAGGRGLTPGEGILSSSPQNSTS